MRGDAAATELSPRLEDDHDSGGADLPHSVNSGVVVVGEPHVGKTFRYQPARLSDGREVELQIGKQRSVVHLAFWSQPEEDLKGGLLTIVAPNQDVLISALDFVSRCFPAPGEAFFRFARGLREKLIELFGGGKEGVWLRYS